jgi:hypothetical protein
MRQQTVYAIDAYIKRQSMAYVYANKEQATRMLECAANLIPLVEHLGLAKDF